MSCVKAAGGLYGADMRTALASVFVAAALCGAAWAASGSEVIAKIDVGGQPCGVVGTPAGVWVSDAKSGDLIKLDPATSTVALRVKTNAVPCEITLWQGLTVGAVADRARCCASIPRPDA